jgi:hypothetical protein
MKGTAQHVDRSASAGRIGITDRAERPGRSGWLREGEGGKVEELAKIDS